MDDLAPEPVDLWFTFYEDIRDERLLAEYARLLTEEESAQQQRFYFDKDRHRYLVTRAMVRTVLSRYAPIESAAWRFSKGSHGRPAIENDHPAARALYFNLSHTDGLIMLGVTRGQELGVDTENLQRRPVSIDVADRFFSSEEVAELHATAVAAQHERFFHYWTLKESYIKARGLGLSIPLDQFGFHFPSRTDVQIRMDATLGDSPARWRFWQMRPAPDYMAALCVERRHKVAPRLIMRSVVPMESEEPLVAEVFSASADFVDPRAS